MSRCAREAEGRGAEDSHIKVKRMLIISLRGKNCRFRSYLVFRTESPHFCPKKASLWVVRKEISNHREPTLLFVKCKWKLKNRLNLTCFVLFLNLLRCEVKWKLFYDAKTMFKSTPRLLLISQCNMWFN